LSFLSDFFLMLSPCIQHNSSDDKSLLLTSHQFFAS
jgi:hypothetical protein